MQARCTSRSRRSRGPRAAPAGPIRIAIAAIRQSLVHARRVTATSAGLEQLDGVVDIASSRQLRDVVAAARTPRRSLRRTLSRRQRRRAPRAETMSVVASGRLVGDRAAHGIGDGRSAALETNRSRPRCRRARCTRRASADRSRIASRSPSHPSRERERSARGSAVRRATRGARSSTASRLVVKPKRAMTSATASSSRSMFVRLMTPRYTSWCISSRAGARRDSPRPGRARRAPGSSSRARGPSPRWSSRVSKSTVTQNGVPISSWRR